MGAYGSLAVAINRTGEEGDLETPCVVHVPLCPLPTLLRVLPPNPPSLPGGIIASYFQARALGQEDAQVVRKGFASHGPVCAPELDPAMGKRWACKRLKLAPVFTFVGCHTA